MGELINALVDFLVFHSNPKCGLRRTLGVWRHSARVQPPRKSRRMTLAVKVATRPHLLELRESAFRLADSLEIFYTPCVAR